MSKFNLEKNGIEIVKLNKNIRKLISEDIKKDIHKKLGLNKNISFDRIANYINELDNITFDNLFGSVANRYLSYKVTKKINLYIDYFKLNRNFRKVFLHQMTPLDLKVNKKLKKNNYCVYYRIVRKKRNDTLFIHRDCDFWKLHSKNKKMAPFISNKYTKRIKIWLPIYGCNSQNSLKFFNYSHLHNIKCKYKTIKGLKKPEIDQNYVKINKKNIVMPFKNFDSDVVMFDDECVHFAPTNTTSNLRISCEFTAMVLQ